MTPPWKELWKPSLSLGVMHQQQDRRRKPGLWEGFHPDEHRQSLCWLQTRQSVQGGDTRQGNGGTQKFLAIEVHTRNVRNGLWVIITMMVLARLLNPAEMGQIAVLGIIFGYMQFLGALGLNQASPLVIPEAESEGK